jgi:hypothetical protein
MWCRLGLQPRSDFGCGQAKYSTAILERFDLFEVGSGRVKFPDSSRGRVEIRIQLDELQPDGNHWLCLNALTAGGVESRILGSMRVPG